MEKINKDTLIRIGTVLVIILLSAAVIWGAWRPKSNKHTPAGATNNTTEATEPPPSTPVADPVAIYQEAISNYSQIDDQHYNVTGVKKYALDGCDFTENYSQQIVIENRNAPEMAAQVTESLRIGSYSIESVERFYNGTAYFTTQEKGVQAPITPEAYLGRYAPALLITPQLYKRIEAKTNDVITVIQFSEPSALESWVGDESCIMQGSSGELTIDRHGNIVNCKYNATYTMEDIAYSLQLYVEIVQEAAPPLAPPKAEEYLSVQDPDIIKTLERACGYLSSAERIDSTYAEHIFCQVFGDTRTQEILLKANKENGLTAEISTTTAKTNTGQPGAVETTTFQEVFKDNSYEYSIGGDFTQAEVDRQAMLDYCQSILVGTIPLPEHISGADISFKDGICSIDFQTTEAYAKILAEDAFLIMYPNALHPEELASHYKTESVTVYLTLDARTGFPLSAGFSYKGSSSISDLPYELTFKADQTYALPEKSQ